MASVKELKKEIDRSFSELGFLCHVAMVTASDADSAERVEGVYADTVDKVNEVMKRVNHRDKAMRGKEVKRFFNGVRSELTELFTSSMDKVSGMLSLEESAEA